VGAFPEHAPAGVAGAESLVELPCHRRQRVRHLLLVHGTQRHVARQAQRERARAAGKVEAREDLVQLALRLQRTHVAAVRDRPALEQLAVAREHDAPFLDAQPRDLVVVDRVGVDGVESGQAQQPGERAEVRVGDEARIAQRRVSHAQ